MRRGISKFLTVTSSMFFAAICVLWVCGFQKPVHFQFTIGKQRWQFSSKGGGFSINNDPQILNENAAIDRTSKEYSNRIASADEAVLSAELAVESIDLHYEKPERSHPSTEEAAFRKVRLAEAEAAAEHRAAAEDDLQQLRKQQRLALASLGTPTSEVSHSIPIPLLAFCTIILPALAFRNWLALRAKRRNSRCIICGYDLRATPDRCPECGAVAGKR